MFERLWRGDAKSAPAVREQLNTADLQGRAILVEAIARIDERVTDLEESPALAARDDAEIEAWQLAVAESSDGIARGLEQLADVCELISERLEAHRLDSQALREAMALLAPSLQPSDQPAQDPPVQAQVTEPIPAPPAVEISHAEGDDAEEDDEISLVGQENDEISLIDDVDDDAFVDDPAEYTDAREAHTILEQLTEVLNRRNDREALRLSTRLRRLSTSQWARLREYGDGG